MIIFQSSSFTNSFEEIGNFIANYEPPKAREYHGE